MSWLPAHLACHCSGLYDPSSTQRLAPCCAHCPLALASLPPFPPPACHAVAKVLEVECRTLLNMLQMMVGVVLPTLLAAYTARTTGQTAPAHARQRQQQRQPPHRRTSVKPGLLGWAVQQSQRAGLLAPECSLGMVLLPHRRLLLAAAGLCAVAAVRQSLVAGQGGCTLSRCCMPRLASPHCTVTALCSPSCVTLVFVVSVL